MYQDFIFAADTASGAAAGGLDLTLAGLASNAIYSVTLWSYDSASSPTRSADWGPSGGSTVTLGFDGDLPGSSPDPNTTLLTDYSVSFNLLTSGAGSVVIEGRTTSGFGTGGVDRLNVFLNGLRLNRVPEPATPALLALGLAGIGFSRRRK